MNRQQKVTSGFTIVELLIVIVVIGILAAITIAAYNGVQAKARDNIRIDGISKIRKALELYRIDTGTYPNAINSGTNSADGYPGGGWEVSSIAGSLWLNRLAPYMGANIPTDPMNDSEHYYYYFFYGNNVGMCGAATPNCYKLGIAKLDTVNGLTVSGVDTGATDIWRNAGPTRAVWTARY